MKEFVMDSCQIMECLPHRFPFLLVDRVIKFESKCKLIALKNITINEPFFNGHFPGRPVMPGVLMIEALAQASNILALKSTGEKSTDFLSLFAGLDKVRFKRMVTPGDQLILEINVIKIKGDVWKVRGTVTVEQQLACIAELTSAKKKLSYDEH